MTSPSWFRSLWPDFIFASDKAGSRTPRCRRLKAPLSLEYLEDRMVPSAASSNMVGGVNNGTVNPAPPSIGVVLPITTTNSQQTNAGLAAATFPATNQLPVLGVLASTQTQGQLYGQFRAVSVNSQGQSDQFNQTPWMMMAYGFGSGTQPGQPWAPAAYNVGLANHQFSFSANSDSGIQVMPPWTRPTEYRDGNEVVSREEDETLQLLEPAKSNQPDSDNGQDNEGQGDEETPAGSLTFRTLPVVDPAIHNVNPASAAVVEAPLPDDWIEQETGVWEDGFSYTVASVPGNYRPSVNAENMETEIGTEEVHFSELPTLSRSLCLFSLTPMQFSALLTGLALSALQIKSAENLPETVPEEPEEEPVA